MAVKESEGKKRSRSVCKGTSEKKIGNKLVRQSLKAGTHSHSSHDFSRKMTHLSSLYESFGTFPIPSSKTGSDEIGNPSASLCEGLWFDSIEKLFREALHFHQTYSHDGSYVGE